MVNSQEIIERSIYSALLGVAVKLGYSVNPEDFPEELEITSIDKSGMIMSLKHKKYDVHAVQYHPESILTPKGREILINFLKN